MATKRLPDRYRNRLVALIAFILGVAALRASYPVTMPILFTAVIVAALWPLKRWLDRCLPSWLSYVLTILALVVILSGFAAAVAASVCQVIGVIGNQWSLFVDRYDALSRWLGQWGVSLNPMADKQRIFAFVGAPASGIYQGVTYIGFIGLLVVLGLPEVRRFKDKMQSRLDDDARSEMLDMLA